MKRIIYMASVVFAAMAISSCNDDSMSIGGSLTSMNDNIDVATSTFYATSRTYMPDSVLSLTTNCYLGRIEDPATANLAEVKSEFSTQFHIMEKFTLSTEDKVLGRTPTGNRAMADSCDIILYLSSPFLLSDTMAAMKMEAVEMAKAVEYGKMYYTNFNLEQQGYLRTDGIIRSKMFTYVNLMDTDNERAQLNYLNNIRLTLNESYSPMGHPELTYPNYGTYLLHQYYDHPEYFKNSYLFAQNVCPGFFFRITDGQGFYAKVTNIGLRVFYRVQEKDSVRNASFVLAGTREVKQTNFITNDKAAVTALANDASCTYLKTPAGLFTEITLPIEEIKKDHQKDSLLDVSITLQRINYNSSDERMLGIPKTVLMIPKDSLISYFEKLKVPDGNMSYMTTFTSALNTYTYSNISKLVTGIWSIRQQGEKQASDWVAKHPDWNKVVLIPITYTTSSTSTTPTRVEHDMSLTSTRLVGGPNHPLEVKVIYGKFR